MHLFLVNKFSLNNSVHTISLTIVWIFVSELQWNLLNHHQGGSRGLVVKVLDSKFKGCEFKTHTGHGSFSKLRQFRLPYFASVYSAANEYKHCDGLVSRPGESV